MTFTRLLVLMAAAACLLSAGCSKPARKPSEKSATENAGARQKQSTGSGPGVLTGKVVVVGKPIPPRRIQVNKEKEFCGAAEGEHQEVAVGADGGVAGAVVEIVGVEAPADGWQWPADKDYVISQKGCMFHPYITVLPEGRELRILNDDQVTHNVNTAEWNEVQPKGADPLVRTLEAPTGTRISCNIHNWMQAWVYTVESPFYTRTDERGEFTISDVPPGEYRVNVWHPGLLARPKRLRVTIGPGDTITEKVEFKSPAGA